MTDEQHPEPLEPVPVDQPTDPAASSVEPPTVETPRTEPVDAPPPPPAPPGRSGVVVPVWALAAVGGVLLLALGFLLGWVLAPDDGDDVVLNPAGNARELPFGGEFAPFSPDGNGNGNRGNGSGGDRWEDRGGAGQSGTAYLGVVVQDSSDPDGAAVVRVAPSSPAARAGLEDGDVITKVDDNDVGDAAALTELIRAHDPRDTVTIEYERDGSGETADVRLGDRPALGRIVPPTTTPRSAS